jgi:hypothetical protein
VTQAVAAHLVAQLLDIFYRSVVLLIIGLVMNPHAAEELSPHLD